MAEELSISDGLLEKKSGIDAYIPVAVWYPQGDDPHKAR